MRWEWQRSSRLQDEIPWAEPGSRPDMEKRDWVFLGNWEIPMGIFHVHNPVKFQGGSSLIPLNPGIPTAHSLFPILGIAAGLG